MMRLIRPVLLVWVALAVLLGLELGLSQVKLGAGASALILLPAAATVLLVGICFMRVGESGLLGRFFALAALFWLMVLLGLGSMDPLTRTMHPVSVTEYP
jgi:caa(3)-type oxidase subunit IV